MAMSKAERKARASMGGLARMASADANQVAAHAREAFEQRFLDEADPTGELRRERPEEALRRAEARRKLYYKRLALASLKSRRVARERAERATAEAAAAIEAEERAEVS